MRRIRARPPRAPSSLVAGTALIEFAMVLPVLLLLFLGGYQVLDGTACKRRVTTTARAIADLVSQRDTLAESDVSTILAASAQIMTPHSISNAKIRVSEIKISNDGMNATVQWGRGLNAVPLVTNSIVSGWPSDVKTPGKYYIYAEVYYSYNLFLGAIAPPIGFTQTIIMVPRKSESIGTPT